MVHDWVCRQGIMVKVGCTNVKEASLKGQEGRGKGTGMEVSNLGRPRE